MLNPAESAALPGPEWLVERRRAAAERLANLPVPTVEEEVWRYSRIGEVDFESRPATTVAGPAPADIALADTTPAAVVKVANGFVVDIAVADDAVFSLRIAGDDDAAALDRFDNHDVVTAINDAAAPTPLILDVPRSKTVEGPILIVHENSAVGATVASRLVGSIGEDAEVTIIEHRTSTAGDQLVIPMVEIDVAQAARVTYLDVQRLHTDTWQLGQLSASVGAQATVTMSQVGLGGGYARMRADCRLVGRGATGNLAAMYFGDEDQTLDFRTFQDHLAPDTTSDLLFKGAVGGHARSVYSGLIRVAPEGAGTNAFQTNHNIKLSEHAQVESVPNLEIENDDVRCSHASTVGPIDADQRFYLESRGVPPTEAERLVVSGFFDEVLHGFPYGSVVDALVRGDITTKLDRRFT